MEANETDYFNIYIQHMIEAEKKTCWEKNKSARITYLTHPGVYSMTCCALSAGIVFN